MVEGVTFQCRYPGGPGCENATPEGPCCGQVVGARASSLWHHVPQDSLRPGSAVDADPPWPSFDVVHRMDYERVLDALRDATAFRTWAALNTARVLLGGPDMSKHTGKCRLFGDGRIDCSPLCPEFRRGR